MAFYYKTVDSIDVQNWYAIDEALDTAAVSISIVPKFTTPLPAEENSTGLEVGEDETPEYSQLGKG